MPIPIPITPVSGQSIHLSIHHFDPPKILSGKSGTWPLWRPAAPTKPQPSGGWRGTLWQRKIFWYRNMIWTYFLGTRLSHPFLFCCFFKTLHNMFFLWHHSAHKCNLYWFDIMCHKKKLVNGCSLGIQRKRFPPFPLRIFCFYCLFIGCAVLSNKQRSTRWPVSQINDQQRGATRWGLSTNWLGSIFNLEITSYSNLQIQTPVHYVSVLTYGQHPTVTLKKWRICRGRN